MNASYIKSDMIINTFSYSFMASSVTCKAGSESVHVKGECNNGTLPYDFFMCILYW